MKTVGYNSLKSWITVIACSFIAFFLLLPMRAAGLFFVTLLNGYDTDREKASVAIVIYGMFRTLLGPFTAFLGETFGFRAVTLTGCILGAVGVGSCYFAEDILTATLCLGLIYGCGLAFGNTLIPTILKLHFTEHINLVNGIVLTGSCVGAIIMSPVITYLDSAYGTKGMFLILGGIFLNTIPAAILLKHPHNERRIVKEVKDSPNQKNTCHQNPAFVLDEEDQHKIDSTQQKHDASNKVYVICVNGEADNKNEKNSDHVTMKSLETDDTQQYFQQKTKSKPDSDVQLVRYTERKPSVKNTEYENGFMHEKDMTNNISQQKESTKSKNKLSWKSFRLFLDPTFHSIMFVQSIYAFLTTLNWTIIVDYARDKGISNDLSVYFAMFIPLAEILGNLTLNWITDGHFMTRTNFSLTCFLILLLDAGYIIWSYNFALMMVGVMIFGYISGAVGTTFPGLVFEYIEEEKQNMALASRFFLYAFLCILKTPIIGYFRETLGSYNWVYVIIISCCFICCVLVKLTPVLASCRNRKKQSKECT
ncbi:monocarboxylate transporter 12-like isoform X3 [Parasteatoda tepidariorum]|uniref:monocarboxylate transporter 12-like isoform X3 n=1 Tax=Parasteatoda tepidariorum TaxID=114398 RepID=UPI001C71EBE0|nr:uncharacterized protein LOC107436509 isoform X3 [Parasteatoda tepidariorum]